MHFMCLIYLQNYDFSDWVGGVSIFVLFLDELLAFSYLPA